MLTGRGVWGVWGVGDGVCGCVCVCVCVGGGGGGGGVLMEHSKGQSIFLEHMHHNHIMGYMSFNRIVRFNSRQYHRSKVNVTGSLDDINAKILYCGQFLQYEDETKTEM